MIGAVALALANDEFLLQWQHSVEQVTWREAWRVRDDELVLTKAWVKGSGAGMDPGPGAILRDGWWEWTPDLPPQSSLLLAASGATQGGWQICTGGSCREFGDQGAQPLSLRPCIGQSSPE